MRKVARYILVLIVLVFVGGAIAFVWAMQRDIDISSPEARDQQRKAMVLGCKVKLPDLQKSDPALQGLEISPELSESACGCAADLILAAHGKDGTIRPLDVPETEIDAAERTCLLEMADGDGKDAS